MGLLVDLPGSAISFGDTVGPVILEAITNRAQFRMYSFEVSFRVRFHPQRGLPRVPRSTNPRQQWQIGIVQNVVFERIEFEYDDGYQIVRDFPEPALDSASITSGNNHRPFYGPPVWTPPTTIVDINTGQRREVSDPVMIPYRNIIYTAQGFGEANPSVPTSLSITNDLLVNMIDRPSFGTRLRRGSGILIRAGHILAFQIWCIARNTTQIHILAYVPPFSMISWITTQPSPSLLSTGIPNNEFDYYGHVGIVRTINYSHRNPTITTRPFQQGSGGRTPVLTGQTANERGRQFLSANGLLP